MELLNTDLISEHFLTPKIFKSMKCISHCSSVHKSSSSNFQGIVSTLGKMNTPEIDALQQTSLSLHFVFDYLFTSDIMSHLALCSKIVQQGCCLLWMYPETVDWTSQTLMCMKVSLVLNNLQNNMLLNQGLFPNFFQ